MSSIRARLVAQIIRVLIRRRDWGPPESLARRARRWFGASPVLQSLRSFGITVMPTTLNLLLCRVYTHLSENLIVHLRLKIVGQFIYRIGAEYPDS